jgi:hypothetical protein
MFFWVANAFEASATISQCLSSQSVNLEPAGEFLFLLVFQLLSSWLIAKVFKKDYHSVNTASEAVLLSIVLFKWLHTWLF